MLQTKDPAIKLFGWEISVPAEGEFPMIEGDDLGATLERVEAESDQDSMKEKDTETTQTNDDPLSDQDDSANPDMMQDTNVNPKTPSIDEETVKPKNTKTEKKESDTNNSKDKTLKKPDKILPCPRCNSMETKFCYYNNYNVNQPRHFCKACQRYWTAGGTMRNVPVGAGRRKNQNSASHYLPITISEALQAAQIDASNGTHQQALKGNGRVLSFSLDAPICDSMASVLNLGVKKVMNATRDGPGEACSSTSSITVSHSMEEGLRKCPQELHAKNINGFPSQIPCLPGVPWPYPPAFCPPAFPLSFYPAAYWNCNAMGMTNNISLVYPQPCSPNKTASSGLNSPTLGKHSRDCDGNIAENSEKEGPPKQKTGSVLVPKTLRIDDPNEAAKSSIWATLGIKNESISAGGLFKAFQTKVDEKNRVAETSPLLRANPAALSRSVNFHESS